METLYEFRVVEKQNKELAELVKEFRSDLNELNGITIEQTYDHKDIQKETKAYFQKNKIVIGAYKTEKLIGFLVLKEEERVFWVEWMYMSPQFRGTKCASELFDFADNIAKNSSGSQLYVWVHPTNHRMIRFLSKKGYNVLNLIEITKDSKSESSKLNILGNELNIRQN